MKRFVTVSLDGKQTGEVFPSLDEAMASARMAFSRGEADTAKFYRMEELGVEMFNKDDKNMNNETD